MKGDGGSASDAGVVGMVLVIMWLGEWVKKGEIEIKSKSFSIIMINPSNP